MQAGARNAPAGARNAPPKIRDLWNLADSELIKINFKNLKLLGRPELNFNLGSIELEKEFVI